MPDPKKPYGIDAETQQLKARAIQEQLAIVLSKVLKMEDDVHELMEWMEIYKDD